MKYPKNYFRNPWAKIRKTKSCWLWNGTISSNGYGKIRVNGKWQRAHRVIYEMLCGPIDKYLCACHKCDNKRCVNPSHIFIGTKQDNAIDSVSKGRWGDRRQYGSKNGRAILTESIVLKMRQMYDGRHGSIASLARVFNADWATTKRAIKGESWPLTTTNLRNGTK